VTTNQTATISTPDRIRDRLIARIRACREMPLSLTPNLRTLASELRCTQDEVLQVLDDHPDIEIYAGHRSALGIAALPQGEWKFEYVGEDDAQQARAA